MYVPEREPQVIYETEDYVVVRNLPFGRSEEATHESGPRGLQPSEAARPARRNYTLGRGVAFLPSLIRLGLPVVGTPTSNSVVNNVQRDMPALEPAVCSSSWRAKRRNWG